MFEVGMGFIRNYGTSADVGEITSVYTSEDGETLVSVMFNDGSYKIYTEDCVMTNLGKRIIVMENV